VGDITVGRHCSGCGDGTVPTAERLVV